MGLRCQECGLTNFADATHCKRCQAPLAAVSASSNVWRDGEYLVISAERYALPNRCLKCNGINTERYNLRINFYPFFNFLMILARSVFWRAYTIPAFLCRQHKDIAYEEPKNVLFPKLLIILGCFALLVAVIAKFILPLLLAGLGLLGLGLLLRKFARPTFEIKKRNKQYVWIKGADEKYLASLPKFS